MKTIIAQLQLSTNLSGHTRERCPDVVFRESDTSITSIRSDAELPSLPLSTSSVDTLLIHDDALSRVIDEEAWLTEFSRVMIPGGTLRFTLPAAGVLAWLDTMNLYRYITDISKRGHAPNAALPTGWNRHYTPEHIQSLLRNANFGEPVIRSRNYALQEARLLLGMIAGNWIAKNRETELNLMPQLGKRNPEGGSRAPGTTWVITARKSR